MELCMASLLQVVFLLLPPQVLSLMLSGLLGCSFIPHIVL